MNSVEIVRTLLVAGLAGGTYTKISAPPVPRTALYPYITIQSVMAQELYTHDGLSDLLDDMIQINCWDKVYDRAYNLRKSAKGIILPNTITISGVTIQGFVHVVDREIFNSETETHQLITRIRMWVEA